MVNSQALRLVPGWKLSCLSQALTNVSCTRSSALSAFCARETAKARSEGIDARRSALKPCETVILSPSFQPVLHARVEPATARSGPEHPPKPGHRNIA